MSLQSKTKISLIATAAHPLRVMLLAQNFPFAIYFL